MIADGLPRVLNTLRKFAVNVLLLAMLLPGCGPARAGIGAEQELPAVDSPAPDFQLVTPAGQVFSLRSLRGQAVFLHFWQVNCPNCRSEMPAIQAVAIRYRDQGLTVLGIDKGDSSAVVLGFARQLQLSFPLLLDRQGKVAEAYGARVLPYSFFIDREGVIRGIHVGEMFTDEMIRQVEAALSEAPPE